MLTINEFPKSLLAGIREDMDVGRNNYQSSASPFTMVVPSTMKVETYTMYGEHKGPQEFTGETRYSKLSEYSYMLKNKTYYDALEIDFDLLRYAQTARVQSKAQNFGYAWERGIDKQIITALGEGASNNCYDGTPFFGASHLDMDSGVQSNIFTGTSTFSQATYIAHAQAISGFKDDRGEKMGRRATAVVVQRDSANALEAYKLFNSAVLPGQNNDVVNPFKGKAQVVEVDYMPTGVQFIVLDLSTPEKPIIHQRVDETPIILAAERDSENFMNARTYRYATFQDYVNGYNDWRLGTMQI